MEGINNKITTAEFKEQILSYIYWRMLLILKKRGAFKLNALNTLELNKTTIKVINPYNNNIVDVEALSIDESKNIIVWLTNENDYPSDINAKILDREELLNISKKLSEIKNNNYKENLEN